MNRYSLCYVNLDPTVGAEMKKARPCLIVSPDEMNESLNTVVVAPVTSQYRNIPSRIKIEANETSGLKEDSYVALDQIKTIDKRRCGREIGNISIKEAMQVAGFLCEMFQY